MGDDMKKILAGIIVLIMILIALMMDQRQLLIRSNVVIDAPKVTPELQGTAFEGFNFPDGFDIRKYEGVTLNFIVENNIHANILSVETEEFTKVTGINIKIRPIDYDTFIQKINLDFISKAGDYQLIYSDPYQTLNRFHGDLELLNPYINHSELPQLQIEWDDFFPTQVAVASYFENENNIYAVPFDSTTMIMYYREDVFRDFKDAFMQAKGYDWTPGPHLTWEQYIEISEWIDTFVPNEIVEYGSGQMAQAHNAIFCEFSNILASNGGNYFKDTKLSTVGAKTFYQSDVLSDAFIKSLLIYKEMVAVAAPESVNWNWEDSAEAFSKGKIAMMFNWDENYAALNTSSNFRVRDNIGTSLLPSGTVKSANIYGGSGIGINKYATDIEKEAAWFFITWATSKEMQIRILTDPTGGGLPTAESIYADIDPIFRSENPQIETVLAAWQPENIYLRPKLMNFYEIEQLLITALHDMIVNDIPVEDVATDIHLKIQTMR